jgi:hypothetical protein
LALQKSSNEITIERDTLRQKVSQDIEGLSLEIEDQNQIKKKFDAESNELNREKNSKHQKFQQMDISICIVCHASRNL